MTIIISLDSVNFVKIISILSKHLINKKLEIGVSVLNPVLELSMSKKKKRYFLDAAATCALCWLFLLGKQSAAFHTNVSLRANYIYQDSKSLLGCSLATWYTGFLPGQSGQKLSLRCMLLCPKSGVKILCLPKLVQQSRQQANCPNVYIVPKGLNVCFTIPSVFFSAVAIIVFILNKAHKQEVSLYINQNAAD